MQPIVMNGSLAFLEELSHRLQTRVHSHRPSNQEHQLLWQSPAIAGRAHHVQLTSGMRLVTTNIWAQDRLAFDVHHEPCGLELEFVLGKRVRIMDKQGADLTLGAESFCLSQVKEPTRFRCSSEAGQRHRHVGLFFTPQQVRELLGESPGLEVVIDRITHAPLAMARREGRVTGAMTASLMRLTACPLVGDMRQLCLESEASDLLRYALDVLATEPARPIRAPSIQEVERLEFARTLILSQLSEPPSLPALARRCGLNERKLKEGFKYRFGTTVFGYVRSQRMTRAADMLRRQTRTVTEVALQVGYANPSKFAAAFRRQFGFAPGTLVSS